jgi:4-hydroxy-3-methylbut-2-enyl diphosphate reductase IspH
MTSGASCPDAVVEEIIRKIAGYFNAGHLLEKI